MPNEKRPRSQRSAAEGGPNDTQIAEAVPADDLKARLDELAKLDELDYQQQRKDATKELEIRVAVLDDEVAKRREQLKDDEEDIEGFKPFGLLEPWPDPVNGAKLLDEIRGARLWWKRDRFQHDRGRSPTRISARSARSGR